METLILEKATHLFLSQGFKSITMDDIAAELSISKKTIYQHYASKPELIEKCLVYINDKFLKSLELVIAQNRPAVAEIIAAHNNMNEVFAVETSVCLYQLNKYYPKIAQKQKVIHKKKYVGIIERNLEKGIKEGVYRASLDVEFTARLHIASVVSIDDQDYFEPEEYTHMQLHALHLEHHIRSISTEKGLKQYLELKESIKNE
ncbi:TetR/AcrR family transcriptional regulator [Myroides odoratus]|uniref:HTH-type transcriptional repressor KstR2 n=1 Tax=Myroides odoratus TaxID=256 RepID=A0A378U624_MYROD|nr:TetR/AcrR family transcriptional regulator [Myroides odoratus]MCS4237467.1 AcrR family transcriptional regulator [Myroides odoratus]MDH6601797.1 AcrR family transcriptional regulator [Myroides gitamensis]QQU03001.1 TetR/AcrR family transcriptional regulator [Myroides odoratus]STZ69762.1 HTH-type transcriptional repressor KstR2 [Myroides odoratus]